jgi:uncharacterized protein
LRPETAVKKQEKMGKAVKKKTSKEAPGLLRYHSPNIPMTAIRRYARQIAEKFDPNKIILFGSYAYGEPHEWSDVDILVVMPARNQIDQSLRIIFAVEAPFSVDLIVRTPRRFQRDWEDGDWFLREILAKGKVLYEKTDGAMGSQSRGRHTRRNKPGAEQAPAQ